jgi:hypothetical protein
LAAPIILNGRNADLIKNLSVVGARFVIVGGTAVRFYFSQREADDLDILIEPTERNAQLVINAVNQGGLQWFDTAASELAKPKMHWSVKRDYYTDIITPDGSMDFETIWSTASEAQVAAKSQLVAVRVASITTLIALIEKREVQKHPNDLVMLRNLLTQSSA